MSLIDHVFVLVTLPFVSSMSDRSICSGPLIEPQIISSNILNVLVTSGVVLSRSDGDANDVPN